MVFLNRYFCKFIFLFLLISLCTCNRVLDRVYRAYIPEKSADLYAKYVTELPQLDVWLSTRLLDERNQTYKYYSEFRLRLKESELNLVDEFSKLDVKLELLIDDLNAFIDEKEKRKEKRFVSHFSRSQQSRRIIGRYASYAEITDWMFDLAKKYPKLVQIKRIGKTFEGRQLLVLRLTHLPKSKEKRPLFLYESGIHAREWISIATNLFIIDKLINQYLNNDETVVKLLTKFELHFIPMLNPDGYEYSRASKYNRYWRKNMRYTKEVSSEYSCYGVDLNRNFDYKWMVSGASVNPCSEVYAGTQPGSEAEVKSLMNYIMTKSPRWVSYISLHCYGAVWLSPYSYSKKHIQTNFEETCQKAMVAINKIYKTHNFKFKFGSASYELYEASGCGEDWAHAIANINHTYVIELKPEKSDTPESGFEHPENKIAETSLEMYDGFIEYMKTFLPNSGSNKIVGQEIVMECQKKLKEMKRDLENNDYDQTYENDEDTSFKYKISPEKNK